MRKLLVILFCFGLFFTSCFGPDIRFVKPQPEHLEELVSIPKRFQGVFVVKEDTIEVTKHTINKDSIHLDDVIVKGWGNYLFVNILEDGLYKFSCGKLVSSWNHEELSIEYFDSSEWGIDEASSMNEIITNNKYPIVDIDTTEGYFILDNVNVNHFQSLLNNAKSQDVIRIK